ncbi:MAG: hypothetical protein KF690_11495 [Bacteroidetes bacterium]|nr:hypothetical protein [Bacteroidota bacterium]
MKSRYIKSSQGRLTFYFPEWADLLRNREFLMVVVTNLMPLLGVILWDWSALEVILIYFVETILIGVFNILYMGFARQSGQMKDLSGTELYTGQPGDLRRAKRFNIPLFVLHYGFFVGMQAWFIFPLIYKSPQGIWALLWDLLVQDREFRVSLLLLLLTQLLLFVRGYLFSGAYRTAQVTDYFLRPYSRILLQQAMVLLGAWAALLSGNGELAVLVVLVWLHAGLDTIMIFNPNLLKPAGPDRQYFEWEELPSTEWDPKYWPPQQPEETEDTR